MKGKKSPQNSLQYMTWYDFKKELEKRAGRPVLNWDWLTVKPVTPLPWNDADIQSALLELTQQNERINLPGKTRQTVY